VYNNDLYLARIRALIDQCRNSPNDWAALLKSLHDSEDPIMRFYADVEGLAQN
jgi:hypothetical protein